MVKKEGCFAVRKKKVLSKRHNNLSDTSVSSLNRLRRLAVSSLLMFALSVTEARGDLSNKVIPCFVVDTTTCSADFLVWKKIYWVKKEKNVSWTLFYLYDLVLVDWDSVDKHLLGWVVCHCGCSPGAGLTSSWGPEPDQAPVQSHTRCPAQVTRQHGDQGPAAGHGEHWGAPTQEQGGQPRGEIPDIKLGLILGIKESWSYLAGFIPSPVLLPKHTPIPITEMP